ncbi:N-acetylmuramoyl-L-alanine amidase [Lysinibacillus contaminans]|uniref:N-acetylmuramoyl-L-alanine amidase n=1 Tax=Lysinibacillus contaminans TaxID=1293441 RepID=A0ABR5JZ13_9BACI|nr:SH3 domain-containing protein [Lysinibacillus contaminans]KOS67897.1 N-acetylmuramoyl-L-alanine amidase [Lysinibacillus contaminans]
MIKKQIHIAFILLLLFTITIPSMQFGQKASADTSDLKVTGTILHLREGPGLSYPIVTTLNEGDTLTSIERQEDWIQVKTGDYEGWVASWLTTPIKADQTVDKTVIAQVDRLNIRTEPDISSVVLGQLSTGNQAVLIQESGEWAKINWNGLIGWVSTSYVTINETTEKMTEKTTEKTADETTNTTTTTSKNTTFTVLVDSLNVRKKADLTAKKIGTVSKGQVFKVLKLEHNWVQIQYNDKKTGWVYSFYGTFSDTAKTSSTSSSKENIGSVTIIYNGTNLRTDATTTAEVVERVDAGETYPIIGTKGDFYEIQLDNKTAYVANWVVSTDEKNTAVNKEKNTTRKKGTLNGITIVVDAGHGGNDHGTTGYRGTDEKGITLKTASLLASKLSAAGANVIMTRESDEYVDLRKRVSISHQHEADAFISIHYDATDDSSISGFTSYYLNDNQKGLAEAVHNGLASKIDLRDRGAQPGNYLVLRENRQQAVLVELGFLSNAGEERAITTAKFREQASLGIYQGILDYFN